MNPELERKIERDVRGIDITDELISLNKEYKKLDILYNKYEELIDTVREMNSVPFYNDNEETKALYKLQKKIAKRMEDITEKVQKDLLFIRLGKCAMIQKALK